MLEALYALGLLLVWLGLYLIPSIIAVKKDKKQATAIIVLNLLTGWTVVGWIAALIWSIMED